MVAWSAFTAWCRKVWTFGKGWLAVVFAITTVCLTILVVIQAVAIRQRDTVISWGSVSEAFGAPGTTLAVVVALWQSIVIRRQAKDQAAEAAKQFQAEVDAANARTVQEVEAAERRSAHELAHARELHEVEMTNQRELARLQRVQLLEQSQKEHIVQVSRAVDSLGHSLAKLWNEGAKIARLEDHEARITGMDELSKEHSLVAKQLGSEIAAAHLLIQHQELHDALDELNLAVQDAILVELRLRNAYIAGRQLEPSPIPAVMAQMHERMGIAWRLTGDLLRTGYED